MVLDWKAYKDKPQVVAQCLCGNWYPAHIQTHENVHYTQDGCPMCGEQQTQTPPPYDGDDDANS